MEWICRLFGYKDESVMYLNEKHFPVISKLNKIFNGNAIKLSFCDMDKLAQHQSSTVTVEMEIAILWKSNI